MRNADFQYDSGFRFEKKKVSGVSLNRQDHKRHALMSAPSPNFVGKMVVGHCDLFVHG